MQSVQVLLTINLKCATKKIETHETQNKTNTCSKTQTTRTQNYCLKYFIPAVRVRKDQLLSILTYFEGNNVVFNQPKTGT